LCPDADPGDGEFSVLVARESDRHALAAYLHHRTRGRAHALGLECLRARRVEIERGDLLHIDDALHQWPSEARVSIRIEPAAVEVLVPPEGAGGG
jgi:diacylglycerol kinase family enzyme